jgi:hypothetical protein
VYHCTALHWTALHCTALHCTGIVIIRWIEFDEMQKKTWVFDTDLFLLIDYSYYNIIMGLFTLFRAGGTTLLVIAQFSRI